MRTVAPLGERQRWWRRCRPGGGRGGDGVGEMGGGGRGNGGGSPDRAAAAGECAEPSTENDVHAPGGDGWRRRWWRCRQRRRAAACGRWLG